MYFENCQLLRDIGPYKKGAYVEDISADIDDFRIKIKNYILHPKWS